MHLRKRVNFTSRLPMNPQKTKAFQKNRLTQANFVLLALATMLLFQLTLFAPPDQRELEEFAPKFELGPTPAPTPAPTRSPFISVVLRTWSDDAAQANLGLDSVVEHMKSQLLEVVIVTDESSEDKVRSDLYDPFRERHQHLEFMGAIRLEVEPKLFRSGLLQQKYSKLMADTHTNGEYIFHLDSDAALLQWDDGCYMKEGLPVNDFAPFDYIANQGFPDIYGWKHGTELVLGIEEETHEFSRLNQHVYPRELYGLLRDRVKLIHNVTLEEAFRKLNLKASEYERQADGMGVAFSDFNLLGATSYHFSNGMMYQHDLSKKRARWRKVCVTHCNSRVLSEDCCKSWVKEQSSVASEDGFPKAYFEKDYCETLS